MYKYMYIILDVHMCIVRSWLRRVLWGINICSNHFLGCIVLTVLLKYIDFYYYYYCDTFSIGVIYNIFH